MANLYASLIERVFFQKWKKGVSVVEFERTAIEKAAVHLDIALPKNIGDAIYSFRYRRQLPQSIIETAPAGAMVKSCVRSVDQAATC